MNPPPDFKCLNDGQFFIWRPMGVLDEAKTSQLVAYITEQETKYGRACDRFTDLSRLDAIDLTFKYVFQVALYRRLARLGREPVKSAFLVTNTAVAKYVKLHALITDHSPLEVAMFTDHEAAATWLGIDPALLAED